MQLESIQLQTTFIKPYAYTKSNAQTKCAWKKTVITKFNDVTVELKW
jgi:hypothetical protein